jgi:hypothetical protein
MDFGDALRAVKAGKKVQRDEWNGKGMRVGLYPASSTEWLSQPYLYLISLKGVVPWTPSQTDVLSDDWRITNEPVFDRWLEENKEWIGKNKTRRDVDRSQARFNVWVASHPDDPIKDVKPWLAFLPDSENPVGCGVTMCEALRAVEEGKRVICFIGHYVIHGPGARSSA